MHAVVANLLHTRKERVWIVRNTDILHTAASTNPDIASGESAVENEHLSLIDGSTPHSDGSTDNGESREIRAASQAQDATVQVVDRLADEPYIERQIVGEIVTLHDTFLACPRGGSK